MKEEDGDKKKPNCWTKWGVLVQCVVGVVIGFAAGIAYCNLKQQGDFNRNTLRPWVTIIPHKELHVKDGTLSVDCQLLCKGRTSAYNIKISADLSQDSTFSIDTLRRLSKIETGRRYFLIPDQEGMIYEMDFPVIMDIVYHGRWKTIGLSRKVIIGKMNRGMLFLHAYIAYEDFDENPYGLKITFKPVSFDTSTNECTWELYNAAEGLID